MTMIIKVLVFILGIYISMRMIAALFGIIDFRYTMKTAYPRVIGGILFWGIITACLAMVLGQYRPAFLWGLAAYVFIYVLSYLPSRLRLIGEVKSVDIE
ncbi:MAG: hypothetical protein JRJ85_03955 [Deltaproteobacteria bacterium]|nr:hypothetical protein [Deltaproteobacteria bacterium]